MESTSAQPKVTDADLNAHSHQAFQHAHTSIGAGSAGHWIRTAGILAPLIIGEIVKDHEQRWRWIRISSVATALVSEGLYAHRVQQERKRCEERER